ncbi:hypothetical protein HS7_14290 [Sulfolobales archaeon HS-7]|nr:hypothetical protein HS7_14290 [Sulfolobales archaeon HS-7]
MYDVVSLEVRQFADLLTERGATIIIGAEVSYELGYPLSYELASALAQEFDVQTGDLESVVKDIIDKGVKREDIIKKIREIFDKKRKEGLKRDSLRNPYSLLARILRALVESWKREGKHLTVNIITTNFDRELEDALKDKLDEGSTRYTVVKSKDDFSQPTDAYIRIYKVHGDIYEEDKEKSKQIVLTQDDLKSFEEDREAIYISMKGHIIGVPLLVVGHSFRDKDLQVVYEEVKKALGDVPTFDVHPGGEKNIEEAVTIPETSSEFLKELMVYLRESKGFKDLPNYADYGVELSVDASLKEALEKAKERGVPVVLFGHRYSGKTMAILRARKKGILPEEYSYVELPYYSMDEGYAEKIKDRLHGKVLIEGSNYQIRFLKGEKRGDLHNPIFGKDLLNRVFGKKGKEEKRSWIPEGSVLVESKITKEDAEGLFEYFLKKIADKRRGETGLSEEELRRKRCHLLELASFGGSPLEGNGLLIPPLLERVIEEHAGKSEEILEKLKELERHREELLLETFGLSLSEGMGALGETLEYLKGPLLPTLSRLISEFLLPASVILFGVSLILSFYEERKDAGLGKYVKLHKAWNEYPVEKREILCEKLDEKYGLNPGDCYSFLSSWLSPVGPGGGYDEFLSRLKQIFTEDYIKKLNEVIRKVPELESEVKKIKERIDKLEEIINRHEEEIKKHEEEINRLKEGQIKQAGLKPEDKDSIKEYYGVNEETLVEIKQEKVNELANEILSWRKHTLSELSTFRGNPLFYAVIGPSGVGKSWFSYLVVKKLMERAEGETGGKFVVYSIQDPRTFKYPPSRDGKCLLILDDGRVTTNMLQEHLTNVLHEAFIEGNAECPILITTEETMWRSVVEKAEMGFADLHKGDLWRKLRERGNLFKEIRINTNEDELMKILESMLSENIKISDELKRKIVKRARLPVVLRYFLEGKENISEEDLDEIDRNPKTYAFRKIQQFYFKNGDIPLETESGKKEFLLILALLGAMLESKGVPIAAVDKERLSLVGLNTESSLLYRALDSLISLQRDTVQEGTVGVVRVENGEVNAFFPFFRMDHRGILSPIHGSVKEGYNILVGYLDGEEIPDKLEDELGHENLITKLGKTNFDFEEFDKYLNRIREELKEVCNSYGRLILQIYKDSESYIKNHQRYFSRPNNVSTFLFDAISVVPYFSDEDFKVKILEVIAYLLERYSDKADVIQTFEVMMRPIAGVINKPDFKSRLTSVRESPYKSHFNNLILRMLSATDEYVCITVWSIVNVLIDKGILTLDEVRQKKDHFLSLLESPSEYVRSRAWSIVNVLIDKGILTREDSKAFLSLLESPSEYVRSRAWDHVNVLIDKGILTLDEVRQKKDHFLSLLESPSEYVRSRAWDHVNVLIDKGILTLDEVRQKKDHFLSLLESPSEYVRSHAWDHVNVLIDKGILTLDEVRQKKDSPF